jgi:diguanylate cyclase (GGDEF)-like protein
VNKRVHPPTWRAILSWIGLLACMVLLGAGRARANELVLRDGIDHVALGPHVQVLEDTRANKRLEDILTDAAAARWTAPQPGTLNFGYSRSAFWLRADVRNESTQTHWLLGLRYPLLDYIDIYVVWPDGRVQHQASGDRRPYDTRSVDDRHVYFALDLPRHAQVQVYTRVQGQGSLQIPLEISTPASQDLRMHHEQLLLGLYFGALLVMLLYNLLLSLSLREHLYLYYALYMAVFGVAQMTLNGLAFQYLWPHSPAWGNAAMPFFLGLSGCTLLLFCRRFLDLHQHLPRTDRALQALQWLFLVVALGTFLASYSLVIQIGAALALVTPMLLLVISAVLLQRGVQQARYFLLAFGGLLVGIVLITLHLFGVTAGNVLTEYGLQIGSMIEFTMLSVALAHRLHLARKASEQLQKAHAEELETRVRTRTEDLRVAMAQITEANARLQELNELDTLTGLKNRMFLTQRLPEVWKQAQRWQTPLSVLMIDADHFKRINDQHGHLAGDEALRQIANVIRAVVQRPGDHAVRFGGEEFLVVLPQTNTVGAAHIAESIRRGVAALTFQHAGQPVPLTVSIGVASVVPDSELQPQALLNAADMLLYQAKQKGRNQCALLPQALATLNPDRLTPQRPDPVSSE